MADPFSPSASGVGALEKLREWRGYFAAHRRRGERDLRQYLADVAEYDALLRQHCGRGLGGARVLEIGFGTRPSRLAGLSAAGADPVGVDIEVPLLRLNPATMREIQRRNGTERLAKSVARYLLFDRGARRRLRAALGEEYGSGELDYGRLEVCDARDLELAPGSLDLVTSEDVFEHMTVESLDGTLAKMREWLKPGAIALIRPNVYPGISGGHLAEWNVESVLERPLAPRRAAPWEHLRDRRHTANTFMNEMRRADYRQRFTAAGFEILAERPRHPNLGRELLTAELRRELDDWPDEELFSNQTLFVLRPA